MGWTWSDKAYRTRNNFIDLFNGTPSCARRMNNEHIYFKYGAKAHSLTPSIQVSAAIFFTQTMVIGLNVCYLLNVCKWRQFLNNANKKKTFRTIMLTFSFSLSSFTSIWITDEVEQIKAINGFSFARFANICVAYFHFIKYTFDALLIWRTVMFLVKVANGNKAEAKTSPKPHLNMNVMFIHGLELSLKYCLGIILAPVLNRCCLNLVRTVNKFVMARMIK